MDDEEHRRRCAAVISVLWTVVARWEQIMYTSVAYFILNLEKKKKRKRDDERSSFVRTLTRGRDSECVSQLRMNITTFNALCDVIRSRGLLQNTKQIVLEEQLAMFLHTLGHNVKNRTNSVRFYRSGETVSRHFHRCLQAITSLGPDYIRQAGIHTPRGPPGFEDCVGAIDGTHIPVFVPLANQGAFRNRKGTLSQNVMAVCGFDLKFQYILAGWEGSAADARVLQNALTRDDCLVVPEGKYYLVDAGYANAPGFLSPFRGVRYHLNEHRGRVPENEKELYNKLHSQSRNVIERAFGILKARFPILKIAPQYSLRVQVAIVTACCILHNFIREHGGHEFDDHVLENEVDGDLDPGDGDIGPIYTIASQQWRIPSQRERDNWKNFRENIAMSRWLEYTNHRVAMHDQ